jgi:hypothetical protein
MKLVRIVSETPYDATDLISFLENNGFMVQTGQVSDPNQPSPDFEIDLRVRPAAAALHLAREMASGEVDVFIAPEVFADAQPQTVAEPVQSEEQITGEGLTFPADEQPALPVAGPVVAVTHFRNSIGQVLKEAALTLREGAALCWAELMNSFEQAREWLAQARVLLIRKRTLVETRAIRARSVLEHRLRFDSASQNAWIRSAFAGAGLMVVLLGLMLWKDQRFASANRGSVNDAGAASILKPTTTTAPAAEAGTSAPATVAPHRRLPSDRADIVDNREVIIRHYRRQSPKRAAAIDTRSGIKHISDMN